MQAERFSKPCEHCGTIFEATKVHIRWVGKAVWRKFCSSRCRVEHDKGLKGKPAVCPACGKDFVSAKRRGDRRGWQRFCSVACSNGFPIGTTECESCKKQFAFTRKRPRFCSRKCRFDSVPSVCANCQKPFLAKQYRPGRSPQTYCSRKCMGQAQQQRLKRTCQHCGVEFFINPSVLKLERGNVGAYCSRHCHYDEKRKSRESRRQNNDGYVMVFAPDHPTVQHRIVSKRYVYEHRLVMEQVLGRLLDDNETIHHKNGVRDDNRPENLELWTGNHKPGQRKSDLLAEIERLRKHVAQLETQQQGVT